MATYCKNKTSYLLTAAWRGARRARAATDDLQRKKRGLLLRTGFIAKLCFIAYELIALGLIVLCALMIGGFSKQNAGMSSALSMEVTDVVIQIIQPEDGIKRNTPRYEKMHNYVRKAAHALEYSLLALAVMMVFAPYRMGLGVKVFLTLVICAGFAGFDEWTQVAVDGRSAALRDVAIDTAGALCGCLAAIVIQKMIWLSLRASDHWLKVRER